MNFNQLITHFVLEYIGSFILGLGLHVFRLMDRWMMFGYVMLPFFAVAAVASCYRVTGGHLNPIITVAQLARRDKPDGFNYFVAGLYIFAQYAGFWTAVPAAWWFTRDGGELKIARRFQSNWLFSEAIGMETF